MNRLLIIFCIFLISGCANKRSSERSCGENKNFSIPKSSVKKTNVNLLARPKEPSFYIYSGESDPYNHYAILFNPGSVVGELENYSLENPINSKWVEPILEKVKADLPLKENTDLEKYGLLGRQFMGWERKLVLNLIEKNKVSIIDFWRTEGEEERNGKVLKMAVVVRIGYDPMDADEREVCEPSGDSILHVIDRVY